MLQEPAREELQRWGLAAQSLAIKRAAVMVSDETVASLTIEANKAVEAVVIIRAHDHVTKVNGNALIADGGTTRISRRAIGMAPSP